MKGFIQRHVWLSAIIGLILGAVLAGGSVMAATGWQSTQMGVSVNGSVTITPIPAPPPSNTYTYTIPNTTVNFAPVTVQAGGDVTLVSDPVDITNTGNQIFTKISIGYLSTPSGLSNFATGLSYTYAIDGSVNSFVITVYCKASTTPQVINLNTMTLSVTPQP